jgi:hypothetical protein
LVLHYSLSGLKQDPTATRIAVYRNGCNNGSVIIEKKILPIKNGNDSRTISTPVSYKNLNGPLLVFCFFRSESLKARGEFKVSGEGLSASADVRTTPTTQLTKDERVTRDQSNAVLTLKCNGSTAPKGCTSNNGNILTLRYNLVSSLQNDNKRKGTAGVYKGICTGKKRTDLQAVIESPLKTIKDGNESGKVSKKVDIKEIPNNEGLHFCVFLSDSNSNGEYLAGQGGLRVENNGLRATTEGFSIISAPRSIA